MNCNKCGKDMAVGEFVEKAGLCTECYLENGRETGDVTRDERALTIPDIYLAEFIGMLHRACDNDRPTEALWGMLDSWCDEQERYLEEKYPTERKQGPCPIGLHFVAKPCESVAPEHTTASIIEDILNTMSAGIDKHTRSPFALGSIGRLGSIALHEQQYEQVKRTLRASEPKEPEGSEYGDETEHLSQEDSERIADSLMKENSRTQTFVTFARPDGSEPVELAAIHAPFCVDTQAFREGLERFAEQAAEAKRTYPVLYPSVRHDKDGIATRLTVLGIDGSGAIAIEPEEPRLESLEWSDNRAPVAPCSCRQFQGDSLECPQHGTGSAWYDLHGGE